MTIYYVARRFLFYTILLPIKIIAIIFVTMLVQFMVLLRGPYHAMMGTLHIAALVTIPLLGFYAVHPPYGFIRPMLIVDVLSCVFVFPLLIVGYDWILNKLTDGFVERSRYFKDSPIYHKNR